MFVNLSFMRCSIKSAPEYPSDNWHEPKKREMATLDFLYARKPLVTQVPVKAGAAKHHHIVVGTNWQLKGKVFLCMCCSSYLN